MNKLNMKSKSTFLPRQSGAALVVSLIILLVLTIIGVNSMSSLVLEERMSSNSRQSMVAAQASEIALRTAETWITTNVNNASDINQFSTGVQGLYSQRVPTNFPFDVFDESAWDPAATSVLVDIDSIDPAGVKTQLVGQDPQFIIEYIGRVGDPPLDPLGTEPDIRDYAFRITAIGFGEDTNARFLAQSTFRLTL